jgi:hypothetical protein
VLTVAVKRDKSISQLRGSSNAHPDDSGSKRRRSHSTRRLYADIRRGREILDKWVEQEGLHELKKT